MQDYDLFGDTLKEITEVVKYDHGPEQTPALILDLRRFLLRHGESDASPEGIEEVAACL